MLIQQRESDVGILLFSFYTRYLTSECNSVMDNLKKWRLPPKLNAFLLQPYVARERKSSYFIEKEKERWTLENIIFRGQWKLLNCRCAVQ